VRTLGSSKTQTSASTSRRDEVCAYFTSPTIRPLFLGGSAADVLREIPDASVDCAMTSPPYWGKRQYSGGGIGLEEDYRAFVRSLLEVTFELHRVLKPTGSFWLNLGDSYHQKSLLCIPWRVAIAMSDEQGWILRNTVVWNKVKGGLDNTEDKLRNVHEPLLHFVKKARGYFYDIDAIRSTPKKAQVVNGAVVSATGVSGVRYKRQIELSASLSENEKTSAFKALDAILDEVRGGKLADFRMIIRGQQRATHSNEESVSGRARDLAVNGFYFLKYHPGGSKPSDVWDIIPEDTQSRGSHFAPYPEDLCKIPITATCPVGGVVVDPFCGTGTTNLVAHRLGRKSIGIDIAEDYLAHARERCGMLL
jgi:DNA modification methylase